MFQRVILGVVTAAALAGTAVVTQPSSAAEAADASRHDVVQQSLDKLATGNSFPGVLATVRERGGRARTYTAGVADLTTREPVRRDSRVRVGSNTKPFTATVVLQLVGEGKVGLDSPVEKYLPGLVRGAGIDGRKITVRQLLQHTSGIPDYDEALADGYLKMQHTYWEPREMVDVALRKKALFAPGAGWEYSNTNYILAGLLVQKITGRPVAEEITRRVIDRIGLRDTYWPGVGDQTIAGPHPRGYYKTTPNGQNVDVTVVGPSLGWAAGQLISTPADLNRFFTALLDGKLLEPAQLKAMLTTVAAPGLDVTEGGRYGLGIATVPLSCGGFAWGHGGDIFGFETRNGVTTDGREAALAVTSMPTTLEDAKRVAATLDTALCH
ncbi:serine hydrolase domain-containing protein [Kribbella sp. HUAS MG21]|uniref:Serine hydrolase domain-containing protein n=1 Tax=Kribbella sp. HUAS MG21 TaxID=3160966 RepID=A0AAU7T6I3_9ACTN